MKMQRKFIILITSLVAVVVFGLIGLVLAQETTPSPTPEVSPSPTPEVSPSPTPEVSPSPTPASDDNVEDIDKVNVERLPFNLGKFQLLGRVTAVDSANKTFAVNGLTLKVASDAKIRGDNVRSLDGVVVDSWVSVSGKIENGVLTAERVVVVKAKAQKAPEVGKEVRKLGKDVEKLREEILKKIEEIQKKIEELRKKSR
jgi:hypothetical protein